MRCFVAVEMPEAALAEVARLQDGMKRRTDAVRWVRPDRMHLTLVFLGEVADDFVERARAPLGQACREHRSFRARLAGAGAFPGPGRARVVWVGMEEGKEELVGLQRSVSRTLAGLGYVPERRPFSPHLTLGRLRAPSDVGRLTALPFRGEPFPVERVTFLSSVLKPSGPEYSRLAEFPLSAPQPA